MIYECPQGHSITHLPCVKCQQEQAREFRERAKLALADSMKGKPKKHRGPPPCPLPGRQAVRITASDIIEEEDGTT